MLGTVAVISLEPWDDTWRRNQHFVARLIDDGHAKQVLFVEPPAIRPKIGQVEPRQGVRLIRPRLLTPRRVGGLRECAVRLMAGPLRQIDLLWVNEPTLGAACLRHRVPAVYDVTDDWREFDNVPRVRRRIIAAEDRLARGAPTIVCSQELRRRWRQRYAVEARVVPNGVDLAAWRDARPASLPGGSPRVGYVGTLHRQRLDVGLVAELAQLPQVGSVHLVGPDLLTDAERAVLRRSSRVRLTGPVPASEVPAVTKAFDVLVVPHLVTPFTLSLDAIKAYEYFSAGRPVVATPTSGFQELRHPLVRVVSPSEFVGQVVQALAAPAIEAPPPPLEWDWSARTAAFADALMAAQTRQRPRR